MDRKKVLRLRYAILIITGIVIIGLIAAVIRLSSELERTKAALFEDEEYISAKNSRVFEYLGERERVYSKDPALGQIWYQPHPEVPKSEVDYSDVETDSSGFKTYYRDGEPASLLGIDVSRHNGDIDWEKVAAQGISFAMIRVGYRGYDEGIIQDDTRFEEYMRGAAAAGIDVGVYFFSQALSTEEAEEEADYVLSRIEGYDIPYPVVFDWEVSSGISPRTEDLPVDTLNECAKVFCNKIAKGGYIPMIYFNRPMGLSKYDLTYISGFDFWLAEYTDEPLFPYDVKMWQYCSDGIIDGIDEYVDIDISFVDYSKERR